MLIWFPQKQTLTWGFECKLNIWNITQKTLLKERRQTQEEERALKCALPRRPVTMDSRAHRAESPGDRVGPTAPVSPTEGPGAHADSSCVC